MIRRRHGKAARRRRWEGLRDKRSRSIFLLPSLLTTGNLFCGFLALLLTVQGRYTDAAISIFVAMVMDLLDGRVARLMKATSQFGVEYDSLADVVSFGVAPAFLMYSFALARLGRPAWFAAFLFAICGALRLARFNVFTGVTDRRFFTGLSIPAGAGVVCSSIVFVNTLEPSRAVFVAMAIGTYLVALLMVSTFKYWSFKEIGWAQQHPAQTLLVVVLGVMIVATNPELFLFIIFTGYALSGPVRRLVVGRTAMPEPAAAKDTP
jgi:CDP-diacylglycerol--serine O-phosphatidyltransferase